MADLQECFASLGFAAVRTYIQSGNVLFRTGEKRASLTTRIEETLAAAFDYRAKVVLRSHRQLRETVSRAPEDFGTDPDSYRYDVLFLKEALKPAAAVKEIPVREDVDRVWPGKGVVYASRLVARATQSRLSRLAGMPIYQEMTIRNWNTTTALLRMLEEG